MYATNVYAEAELAALEVKVAELNARIRAEWVFQIRLGTVADLAGAAGLADPTPFSNWVEGAAQFAQGHWQDGLITVGVGSVPFIGRWAVRWVRGGKTAGVVAHAEPGLIATVPGLPRQGGLNHLEPPALGRPRFDPALQNRPPTPTTRPAPTGHEQPVPVGSAEPPIPRPDPAPTGGGTGGGGGPAVPPPSGGRLTQVPADFTPTFGENFGSKIRSKMNQIRKQYPDVRRGEEGIQDAMELARQRVAQGGGRVGPPVGQGEESAIYFADGFITWVFRPNGQFWSMRAN